MSDRITSARALRAEFWREHRHFSRRMIRDYAGTGKMYPTDVRVAWVNWLDSMRGEGRITTALENSATLEPPAKRAAS